MNLEESYNEDTKSFKEFKNKSFSDQQLITLKKFAKKNNILFFATPGDISSLKRLIKLKFDLIKISSGLSNNFPLLREAIKSKIPLISSHAILIGLDNALFNDYGQLYNTRQFFKYDFDPKFTKRFINKTYGRTN